MEENDENELRQRVNSLSSTSNEQTDYGGIELTVRDHLKESKALLGHFSDTSPTNSTSPSSPNNTLTDHPTNSDTEEDENDFFYNRGNNEVTVRTLTKKNTKVRSVEESDCQKVWELTEISHLLRRKTKMRIQPSFVFSCFRPTAYPS